MINEIWKDVVGYEGLYQVSSCGKVRRIARIRNGRSRLDGTKCHAPITMIELKYKHDKDGYLHVTLTKNGNPKMLRVHRLVAEAFIPNHEKKDIVHHIDECVTNNNLSNLQWVTTKENLYASNVFGKLAIIHGTPIKQLTINKQLIRIYPSLQECSRRTGIDVRHISAVVNGRRKSTGGYVFEKVVSAHD